MLPLKLPARCLSQLGRIPDRDRNPSRPARIGHSVFIDHGMGVVIGETAEVGHRCLLYQGVTLGGTGKEHGKRHPTLAENVVVGAGAKVLGAISIGTNTRIGAGSVVVRDVEADCTVVGIGRLIHQSGVRINPLAHSALPDAEAERDPQPDGTDRRTGKHGEQSSAQPPGGCRRPPTAGRMLWRIPEPQRPGDPGISGENTGSGLADALCHGMWHANATTP